LCNVRIIYKQTKTFIMQKIFFVPVFTLAEVTEFDMVGCFYREYTNAHDDYPDKIIAAVDVTEMGDTFMLEIMKVIDDLDDRTPTFFVDVPPTNFGDAWTNVESFKDKQEAIDYAKKHFGADDNGMICIVSQS